MLKSWFRNTSKKAIGVLGTRSKGVLGSVFQTKKSRTHKPEEIYQSLYKDKIDALMKVETEKYDASNKAQASGTQEQRGTEGGDVDSDVDDGDQDVLGEMVDLPQTQKTPTEISVNKGSKMFKSWQMSTRRRVVKVAWENETPEVRERVMAEVEAEKKAHNELIEDEKVGLDRTPEQRQL